MSRFNSALQVVCEELQPTSVSLYERGALVGYKRAETLDNYVERLLTLLGIPAYIDNQDMIIRLSPKSIVLYPDNEPNRIEVLLDKLNRRL